MVQTSSSGRRADDPSRLLPWLRQRSPLFARVDDATAAQLFALSSVRKEARGVILARQDVAPSHLFIVVEGTLVIRVTSNKIVRELFSYELGAVAGLLALVDSLPSPYEIAAVSSCQVIAIDVLKLAQLTAAYHPTAMALHAAFTPELVAHLRDLDLRVTKLAQRKNASIAGSGETFRRDDR